MCAGRLASWKVGPRASHGTGHPYSGCSRVIESEFGDRAHSEADAADIGVRLRSLGEQRGMSLRLVAKRARITHVAISMIEQNRVSPNLATLKRILAALGTTLNAFFAEGLSGPAKVFFRRQEFADMSSGKIVARALGNGPPGGELQVIHERHLPGSDTRRAGSFCAGKEGGVVVRGSIELTVGSARCMLNAGDGFYFDSRLPHRFRNVGDEICEIVRSVCGT